MELSMLDFLRQLTANPVLLVSVVLTLGVIFVNGWTDAPNAIATCVATRSMTARAAVLMSAVFNFLGNFFMTMVSAAVAVTIRDMVDFGPDPHEAVTGLCAAMIAIITWAVVAWWFGIPTSESHALIAGLTGAAIAMHNGLGGVNGAEWVKVLYGLVLSTVLGFVLGWGCAKLTMLICQDMDRRRTAGFFRGAQIFGGAAMSFMHGAQDGQKFMGVLLLAMTLAGGGAEGSAGGSFPIWMVLLCSIVMSVGTSIGGYRIIKAVGMDMVKLERYQGFAADIAGAICLLLSSLGGIPVSTTHTKTTAVMGVGATKRLSAINLGVVREMVLTWVLTFPGCGLIGYIAAKLLTAIF